MYSCGHVHVIERVSERRDTEKKTRKTEGRTGTVGWPELCQRRPGTAALDLLLLAAAPEASPSSTSRREEQWHSIEL